MKGFDLKRFRKTNKLSQMDIANYLGIGQGYVSQMEHGERPVPKSTIEKILGNADWKMYVEVDEEKMNVQGDNIQQNGGMNNIGKLTGDAEILALSREVAMLRTQVEKLEAEKAAYWELICRLTGTAESR